MKKLSRAQVIALMVAAALVGYNITFPPGKSATSNWRFTLTHPTLLLHVIVATGILVIAVITMIKAIRSRDRLWIALSAAGLIFVLAASASGEDYVMSLHKSALNHMSAGWAGAVLAYATGWYWGHRREHHEKATPQQGK
jgi:hypothetical protein